MKVVIDVENMTLNYETLEKGAEVEVPAAVAKVWLSTGRAHKTGAETSESSTGTEEASSTADKSASQERSGESADDSSADDGSGESSSEDTSSAKSTAKTTKGKK